MDVCKNCPMCGEFIIYKQDYNWENVVAVKCKRCGFISSGTINECKKIIESYDTAGNPIYKIICTCGTTVCQENLTSK